MEQMKKTRNTNLELLRIISMFMIVCHHFSVHGGFVFENCNITVNRLWIQFLRGGGKIGVDIFVLMSGYFLINENQVRIKRIVNMWLQLFTYSVIIYVIFVITGIISFRRNELLDAFFPIIREQWWFASSYFVLYLISPYISMFLISLSCKRYILLLGIETVLWSVIPTMSNSQCQSNDLIWFIYLYSIAGFIRIWLSNFVFSAKKMIMIAFGFMMLTYASVVILDILGLRYAVLATHATYFYAQNHINILLCSVFLFIGFLNMNIKYNGFINTIASSTFGVYLIHDNKYVRNLLWINIFNNSSYIKSKFLILYSIGVIAVVFVVCSLIELVRKCFFEKYLDVVMNKAIKLLDKGVENINTIAQRVVAKITENKKL